MVVPNRHVANLATLTADEQAELMRLTRHAEMALTEAYAPQGINVGINLGQAAGAGVLDHLHVHLVPRWNGDTNFMTAIGEHARAAGGARRDREEAAADLRAPRRLRPRVNTEDTMDTEREKRLVLPLCPSCPLW